MNAALFFNLLKQRIVRPLNLVDVGAAGGALDVWRQFGEKANIFCFEAREGESATLAAANRDGNIEYVPIALSKDKDGIELHLADNLGCSSAYRPVPELCRRHLACGQNRTMRTIRCPSATLDDFIAHRNLSEVHAIKLDTQGSELDILRGSEHALRNCQLVIAETEFNELYSGQNLFCDLDRFLRDRGFVLWRFNNLAHYSTGQIGSDEHVMHVGAAPGGHRLIHSPNGQLFWADALYVRKEATAAARDSMSPQAAIAGAALACQWRFFDLAVEMIRKSGDLDLVDQLLEALGEKFAPLPSGLIPPAKFSSTLVPVRQDGLRATSRIKTGVSYTARIHPCLTARWKSSFMLRLRVSLRMGLGRRWVSTSWRKPSCVSPRSTSSGFLVLMRCVRVKSASNSSTAVLAKLSNSEFIRKESPSTESSCSWVQRCGVSRNLAFACPVPAMFSSIYNGRSSGSIKQPRCSPQH